MMGKDSNTGIFGPEVREMVQEICGRCNLLPADTKIPFQRELLLPKRCRLCNRKDLPRTMVGPIKKYTGDRGEFYAHIQCIMYTDEVSFKEKASSFKNVALRRLARGEATDLIEMERINGIRPEGALLDSESVVNILHNLEDRESCAFCKNDCPSLKCREEDCAKFFHLPCIREGGGQAFYADAILDESGHYHHARFAVCHEHRFTLEIGRTQRDVNSIEDIHADQYSRLLRYLNTTKLVLMCGLPVQEAGHVCPQYDIFTYSMKEHTQRDRVEESQLLKTSLQFAGEDKIRQLLTSGKLPTIGTVAVGHPPSTQEQPRRRSRGQAVLKRPPRVKEEKAPRKKPKARAIPDTDETAVLSDAEIPSPEPKPKPNNTKRKRVVDLADDLTSISDISEDEPIPKAISTRIRKKPHASPPLVSGRKRKPRKASMSRQDDAVDTSSSEEISLGKRKKAHAPAPPKKAITVPKAKDDGKASQMKAAVAHGTRTKSKGTAERPSTGEKEEATTSLRKTPKKDEVAEDDQVKRGLEMNTGQKESPSKPGVEAQGSSLFSREEIYSWDVKRLDKNASKKIIRNSLPQAHNKRIAVRKQIIAPKEDGSLLQVHVEVTPLQDSGPDIPVVPPKMYPWRFLPWNKIEETTLKVIEEKTPYVGLFRINLVETLKEMRNGLEKIREGTCLWLRKDNTNREPEQPFIIVVPQTEKRGFARVKEAFKRREEKNAREAESCGFKAPEGTKELDSELKDQCLIMIGYHLIPPSAIKLEKKKIAGAHDFQIPKKLPEKMSEAPSLSYDDSAWGSDDEVPFKPNELAQTTGDSAGGRSEPVGGYGSRGDYRHEERKEHSPGNNNFQPNRTHYPGRGRSQEFRGRGRGRGFGRGGGYKADYSPENQGNYSYDQTLEFSYEAQMVPPGPPAPYRPQVLPPSSYPSLYPHSMTPASYMEPFAEPAYSYQPNVQGPPPSVQGPSFYRGAPGSALPAQVASGCPDWDFYAEDDGGGPWNSGRNQEQSHGRRSDPIGYVNGLNNSFTSGEKPSFSSPPDTRTEALRSTDLEKAPNGVPAERRFGQSTSIDRQPVLRSPPAEPLRNDKRLDKGSSHHLSPVKKPSQKLGSVDDGGWSSDSGSERRKVIAPSRESTRNSNRSPSATGTEPRGRDTRFNNTKTSMSSVRSGYIQTRESSSFPASRHGAAENEVYGHKGTTTPKATSEHELDGGWSSDSDSKVPQKSKQPSHKKVKEEKEKGSGPDLSEEGINKFLSSILPSAKSSEFKRQSRGRSRSKERGNRSEQWRRDLDRWDDDPYHQKRNFVLPRLNNRSAEPDTRIRDSEGWRRKEKGGRGGIRTQFEDAEVGRSSTSGYSSSRAESRKSRSLERKDNREERGRERTGSTAAPEVPIPRGGHGRGLALTKPAWMTRQEAEK